MQSVYYHSAGLNVITVYKNVRIYSKFIITALFSDILEKQSWYTLSYSIKCIFWPQLLPDIYLQEVKENAQNIVSEVRLGTEISTQFYFSRKVLNLNTTKPQEVKKI
jgi:hypothetical protein